MSFVYKISIPKGARFHAQKYLGNGLWGDDPASTPGSEGRAICHNARILDLVNENRASQVQSDFLSACSLCGILDGNWILQRSYDISWHRGPDLCHEFIHACIYLGSDLCVQRGFHFGRASVAWFDVNFLLEPIGAFDGSEILKNRNHLGAGTGDGLTQSFAL